MRSDGKVSPELRFWGVYPHVFRKSAQVILNDEDREYTDFGSVQVAKNTGDAAARRSKIVT